MDVHMQDIWREKGAAYSSAQPPTGKPISCCQVQCFDAVESFKRREPAVVTPPPLPFLVLCEDLKMAGLV